MKTANKKIKLPGISLGEHIRRMKKTRPDIYETLKNPDPRTVVAWNIVNLRHRLGLTQIGLAEKAGITSRTIQYLEDLNHLYNPTLDILNKVAKGLGVTLDEIVRPVDLTKAFPRHMGAGGGQAPAVARENNPGVRPTNYTL